MATASAVRLVLGVGLVGLRCYVDGGGVRLYARGLHRSQGFSPGNGAFPSLLASPQGLACFVGRTLLVYDDRRYSSFAC